MIADLKPYPEYRETGVSWLGVIPEHWEVKPLRSILRQRNEKNSPVKTEQILSLSIAHGVTLYSHAGRGGNKRKSDMSAYKIAHAGDIVLNSMNVIVGAVGLSRYTGAISPVYYALYPITSDIDILYYDQIFSNSAFQKYLMIYGKGILIIKSESGKFNTIRMKISPDDLKGTSLPLPPPDEQAAIVRFLNHTNQRIERTIRAKRKVIALLNEQKQVIIHRAVTRGLDPNVPLKPSGIPWLGEIPEHWDTRKLKFEMSFRGGGTPSKSNNSYWNGDIPWVSPKDMKSEVIVDTIDHITMRAVIESSTNIVPAGSLLMVVRSGILQRKIPVALCSREVSLNQDMKALSSKGRLNVDFFVLFIRGCERTLLTEWTKQGATVESIEHQFLANTKVPIPPLSEQRAIVEGIILESAPLDTAISCTEREIDLLREYRTRLIADVVTGKLDVREAAALLPDDVEEIAEVMLDDDDVTGEEVEA